VTARFLLDTDWIIDHFNGIAAITHRLEQLRPSRLALSVISLAELYEGVHYARDPAASRRVLSRFVTGLTVAPVDDEICDIFGRERGRLRQLGRTVGDFDLFIAATGLRHDLTVCTNNRRHFEMIEGVRLAEIG
jgi:tRNA(fMet)-specific endonuclease VapC